MTPGLLLIACSLSIATSVLSLVYSLMMWRILRAIREEVILMLKAGSAHYETSSNALGLAVKQSELLDRQILLVEENSMLTKKNLARMIEVLKLLG